MRNNALSIEHAVDVFGCVIGSAKAIYVSSPMTNGPRLFAWLKKNGHLEKGTRAYEEGFFSEVFLPNCKDGAWLASCLRKNAEEFVIDPTTLHVEGWGQEVYVDFWCSVIKKYAGCVYFNSGWEYSAGCLAEFVAATNSNILTLDKAGAFISVSSALNKVDAAITLLSLEGFATGNMEKYIETLSKFQSIV